MARLKKGDHLTYLYIGCGLKIEVRYVRYEKEYWDMLSYWLPLDLE